MSQNESSFVPATLNDATSTADATAEALPPVADAHAVRAADRLAGRAPTGDPHLDLLLPALDKLRPRLQALRASDLAEGHAPALAFQPIGNPPLSETPRRIDDAFAPDEIVFAFNGDMETLTFASVSEISRLLRTGRVTSRALTEMCLRRLKRFGPLLHCVVNLVPDMVALARADEADQEIEAGLWRGPLHGIPYGAKDLFATRGLPTTWGAKPYENQMFDQDAAVIERLTHAGAVLVAKLSMGELAMGDVWFGGKTRNPWKVEDGSSGSSAGSASAVAAGLVPFALGTETLGSIISPCFVCGATGYRPTWGTVSREGAMTLAWSMDKIGPICRTVEDCALVYEVIRDANAPAAPPLASRGGDLSGLRVGVDVASFDALRGDEKLRDLVPVYDVALETMQRLTGATLIPIHLPPQNDAYNAVAHTLIGVEGAASFAQLTASGGLDELAQQEDWNWPNTFRAAAYVPATEYVQALRVRAYLQKAMHDALRSVDVYVTAPWRGPSLVYTNLAGQPEVITRCGKTSEGLPVSLSFVANTYRDADALRIAHAFEQAAGANGEWPNLQAGADTVD